MERQTLKEICEKYSEHITPPFDLLYNAGGFDSVMLITELFGGTTSYIPTARKIFSKCIEEAISHEYDGMNESAIRRKYGFSDVTLRKLLKA